MSELRPFSYDELTGVRTLYRETGPDSFELIRTQDAEPVLEINSVKRSMGRDYYAADPDMWKVATIPTNVLIHWATELGVPAHMVFSEEFAEIISRKLADSAFSKLKTFDGRI